MRREPTPGADEQRRKQVPECDVRVDVVLDRAPAMADVRTAAGLNLDSMPLPREPTAEGSREMEEMEQRSAALPANGGELAMTRRTLAGSAVACPMTTSRPPGPSENGGELRSPPPVEPVEEEKEEVEELRPKRNISRCTMDGGASWAKEASPISGCLPPPPPVPPSPPVPPLPPLPPPPPARLARGPSSKSSPTRKLPPAP